jgi:Gpi18-like mannosyltransferase
MDVVRRYWKETIFVLLLMSAVMIRCHYLGFETKDYTEGFSLWYDRIQAQGLKSLREGFSNYSTSYLFLLYIATLLPFVKIVSIKSMTILFDLMTASVMYRMVKVRYPDGSMSLWAALAVLWAPTVVVNGALWGQCDSIYASFALFSLYAWARRRPFMSFVLFGVAISFKLQAIFLLPLYLVFLARKKVPLHYLLIIPAVYGLTVMPSVMAGRPWRDALGVYLDQAGVVDQFISMAAPNVYQWLPGHKDPLIPGIPLARKIGTVVWAGGLVVSMFWMIRRRGELMLEDVVRYSMFFSLISPFLLSNMHERYFFLADVLSILYAFYFPRMFFVPFLVVFASFFSYFPFLYNTIPVPMGMLALMMGSALVFVTWDIIQVPWAGPGLAGDGGYGKGKTGNRGARSGAADGTPARPRQRVPRAVAKRHRVPKPMRPKRPSKLMGS